MLPFWGNENQSVPLKSVDSHRFVRRGVVGSHKDEMTADVIREFDLWSDINLREYKLHMDDFATYSKFAYNEQIVKKLM